MSQVHREPAPLPAVRLASVETARLPLALATACSGCQLSSACQPCNPQRAVMAAWDVHPFVRRKLRAGQSLYRQGEAFGFIYAVRSGTLKSTVGRGDGRDQVCGFHMGGDVLALDGVASGVHTSSSTALEDSAVCAIAYAPLLASFVSDPTLQRRMNRLLGLEIVRGHKHMLMLGVSSARERVAAFLLDLSDRFQRHGHSPSDFNLRMTRAEIGSFLGMTLETVSRTLSALQQQGAIRIDHRRIRINDLAGFANRFEALLCVR